MAKVLGLTIAAALALAAAPTLTAFAQDDDDFDVDNTGHHDPELGAMVFASGIGRTDARFEFCGWPMAEWTPLREQAMALAPRIYAKAGLPAGKLAGQIDEARSLTLSSAKKVPKDVQCVAQHGPPVDQRVIRWMQDAIAWGQKFLGA